jgi:hypothetical protein
MHPGNPFPGFAVDRVITGSSLGLVMGQMAVDRDLQAGWSGPMGVQQLQLQAAGAGRGNGIQPEENAEGVLPAAGPGVRRAGMSVGPVPRRIGFPDDKKPVVPEIAIPVRRQGELAVVTVRLPDLPQHRRIVFRSRDAGRQSQGQGQPRPDQAP